MSYLLHSHVVFTYVPSKIFKLNHMAFNCYSLCEIFQMPAFSKDDILDEWGHILINRLYILDEQIP